MPLSQIIRLVDDKLRTVVLGNGTDQTGRDRAIEQAVVQYSVDAPRRLVAAAVANGSSIPVPTEWVVGRSALSGVEWPVGRVPMVVVAAAVAFDGTTWSVVLAEPLAAAQVRLHFTAPHVLTDEVSTVPAEHENAVASWAAAELCRQLATQKGYDRDSSIGAAAVNGQSQSGDLSRRAKDWMAVYRTQLGLPDPEKTQGPRAAGAVVAFASDRKRGRFTSVLN